MSYRKDYDREITRWMDKVRASVDDFSRKDRKKIMRRAAVPVEKTAKSLTPVGSKIHKRYSGGKVVATYQPGHLRNSVRRFTFRKSPDYFVGPKFGKGNTGGNFGASGSKVDGYYFRMVYGSTAAFFSNVLGPSINLNRPGVVRFIGKESTKAIKTRGKRRRIATT